MVWLFAAVALILVAALVLRRLLRGATVYLVHSRGYTSIRQVDEKGRDGNDPRPVPRDRYERVFARFLQGDLFDALWVSLIDDPYGGVALSLEDGEVEMDASFRSLKEPEWVEAFKERMAGWGHSPSDEHEWNVGLGVDLQSVTLGYRFPRDHGLLMIVDQALGALQGEAGEAVFVHAWRSQDGPHGVGIKVRRERDVPAEVP